MKCKGHAQSCSPCWHRDLDSADWVDESPSIHPAPPARPPGRGPGRAAEPTDLSPPSLPAPHVSRSLSKPSIHTHAIIFCKCAAGEGAVCLCVCVYVCVELCSQRIR